MLVTFIPLITGLAGDGSNSKEKALIAEDISKVESVPINWELTVDAALATLSYIHDKKMIK
jgi:hypothetical protein